MHPRKHGNTNTTALSPACGQHIELIVHHDAIGAGGKGQHHALIETGHNVLKEKWEENGCTNWHTGVKGPILLKNKKKQVFLHAYTHTRTWWDSVRRRACTSMVREYSWRSDFMLDRSITTMPP